MAKSCNDLWCDPHFDLKIVALILGIVMNALLIHPSAYYYYSVIVNGYHYSYLTVLIALIIACIWFETTVVTEVTLLVVALIKLLVVTAIYADEHRPRYGVSEGPVVEEEQPLAYSNQHSGYYIESPVNRFYVFLVLSIVSLILIIIDVILRLAKK